MNNFSPAAYNPSPVSAGQSTQPNSVGNALAPARDKSRAQAIGEDFNPLHDRQVNVIGRLVQLRNRLAPRPPSDNGEKVSQTPQPTGMLDALQQSLNLANGQASLMQDILTDIESLI